MEVVRPGVRVARGSSAIYMADFATLVLGVVYFGFLTRLVSPREMGVLTVLMFILYLFENIGDLGLRSASPKYIPEFLSRGDIRSAVGVYRKVLKVNLLLGIALSVLCFTLSYKLSYFLTKSYDYATLFKVLSISIVVGILGGAFNSFVQGLQRIKELAGINLISFIVRRFLGLLLLYVGFGLLGIIYGWILGDLLIVLLSALIVRRGLPKVNAEFPMYRLLAFSIPLFSVNVLSYFSQWIDRTFIIAYLPLSDLGVYQVAIYALSVLGMIPSSIQVALYPQLSELYGRNGKSALTNAFRTGSRYIPLILTPAILLIVVLHEPLMNVFAGSHYLGASMPFAIMSFGALAGGFMMIVSLTFMTLEKTRTILWLSLSSFATYFILSLSLIPSLGIIGAAMVQGLSPFVSLALGVLVLRKYLSINIDIEACWKSFVAGFIAALSAFLLQSLWIFDSLYAIFAVSCIFGIAIYVLILFCLRTIHENDILLVEGFLPSMFKPFVHCLRKFIN
jgi:O-antigen/teichoic acid export membrane protein